MATLDENGILFYEETDPISPFHTFLNTGQQATANALADNLRIFSVADVAERDSLALERVPSVATPLVIYRRDVGTTEMNKGAGWRPFLDRRVIREWDLTTGLVVAPNTTATLANAVVISDVPIGSLVEVDLRAKIRINGTTVQTVDMAPVVTGATGGFTRNQTSARYEGGSDLEDTNQMILGTLTASAGTVSLTPKFTAGGGAPQVIVYGIYAQLTAISGNTTKMATAGS